MKNAKGLWYRNGYLLALLLVFRRGAFFSAPLDDMFTDPDSDGIRFVYCYG